MANGALAGPANSTGMTFVLAATRGMRKGVAVGASAQCWFHHHEEHDREHEDRDQNAERAPASSGCAEGVAVRAICLEGTQLRAEIRRYDPEREHEHDHVKDDRGRDPERTG